MDASHFFTKRKLSISQHQLHFIYFVANLAKWKYRFLNHFVPTASHMHRRKEASVNGGVPPLHCSIDLPLWDVWLTAHVLVADRTFPSCQKSKSTWLVEKCSRQLLLLKQIWPGVVTSFKVKRFHYFVELGPASVINFLAYWDTRS